MQLVFVGPPVAVLEALFDRLTTSGTRDWRLDGLQWPIVVLLVGADQARPAEGCRSARTNWDYAVTIRHAVRASIVLVAPPAWDSQPESIDNASERLGEPRITSAAAFVRAEPWPYLLSRVEEISGVGRNLLARGIQYVFRDTRELGRRTREELPWQVVDSLATANRDDLVRSGRLAAVLGLPSLGGGLALFDGLVKARRSLIRLASACAIDGLAEVEEKFLAARVERRQDEERDLGEATFVNDENAIPNMFAFLRKSAGSGPAFLRSPAFYFRVDPAIETWWDVLSNLVLEQLLDAIETRRPQGRLSIRVQSLVEPNRDEPFVTVDAVDLDVVEKSRSGHIPVESASFVRRPQFAEPKEDLEAGHLVDDEVPDHNRPLVYRASVADHRDEQVRVIALDHFRGGGHVHVGAALRNPAPARRSRGMSPFEQSVVLRQAGFHYLQVLAASGVASAELLDEEGQVQAETVHSHKAVFTTYAEHGMAKHVRLLDGSGQELYTWNLLFEVAESVEGTATSRFDDLILAHQLGRKERLITPKICQLREIETQILGSEQSYRSVLACWLPAGATAGRIDWPAGRAGEVPIAADIDKRPAAALLDPPKEYIRARSAVLEFLRRSADQFICELPLQDGELQDLASDYLRAYLDWLNTNPEAAAWAEAFALYIRQEGRTIETLTEEPVVLLLTPLHPIKFAWHVEAQTVLRQGLEDPCPLAGLISPHHTPSITSLPLRLGRDIEWRPFVGMTCDDRHWSALLNGDHLGRPTQVQALTVLRRLGLVPQGITDGMSTGQATRALNDVVGMLAAKATLRVGLVGTLQEEGGSVEGLLEWVQDGFRMEPPRATEEVTEEEAEEAPVPTVLRPASIEVFDFRPDAVHPSEVRLANLSEDVGGRLRWFHGNTHGTLPLDLIIFDQIGIVSANLRKPGWTAESHSVPGIGSLFRIHVREDQDAGRTIAEARVAHQPSRGRGLGSDLLAVVEEYERLALRGATGVSHLVFAPSRQDFDRWIERARFLTATSSQVDPACFIRASGRHDDYLWDYDLPTSAGTDAGAAGYYLIARPRDSMKQAVKRSLAMVTDPAPEPEPVLAEISRRGIPVLKRLTSTGTRAKGEVGVLLAVRLLQDAFRDESTGLRLPVASGNCVNMLLAVDSYQSALGAVRKALSRGEPNKRPDLLVFAIKVDADRVSVKVTPIEVKFHTSQPASELTAAVEQADSLAKVLRQLWVASPVNGTWDVCGRALLAKCLDECFRIYADGTLHRMSNPDWAARHELVMQVVLGQPELGSVVTVNSGRVLAFRPGDVESRPADMNGDGIKDTIIIGKSDAEVLLAGGGSLSLPAEAVVRSLGLANADCDVSVKLANLSTAIGRSIGSAADEPAAQADTLESPGDGELERASAPSAEDLDIDSAQDDGGPDDETAYEVDDGDQPAAGQGSSAVPVELRQRVNEAFQGFVGNDRAVARIKRDLVVGLMSAPPSLKKNYLLVGMPSVGKTELARRVATAIALPLVKLDGPTLASREKLFELINAQLGVANGPDQVGEDAGQPMLRYPPFVVFVDEVHLVPRRTQESLLTTLEAADRSVRLHDRVALVPDATFIFATTQASRLDKAFKSRCAEIQLYQYSVTEVAEMVRDYVKRAGVEPDAWTPDIYPRIAQLGRLVPRRAFEVARELIDELRITEHPDWSIDRQLESVRELMELDENGLGPLDIRYLEVLEQARGPLGEDSVVSMIETVDRDKVLGEIEPLLRRLQLIARTPQGRVITDRGQEYLAHLRLGGA